jgi:undecaprenyl-phosphate 4-deoxy-4-formamido-L-arabinose transferase
MNRRFLNRALQGWALNMTKIIESDEPGISVVVPVYNSQETLAALIDQLDRVLTNLEGNFEAILVNDGSRDNSWAVISDLAKQFDWINGINLMRNYGQHNALLCGIRAARYDVTVTIDDDLQHPPSEIPKLLVELDRGYDVVYGTPATEQHGLWRDIASKVTLKWPITHGNSGNRTTHSENL